MRQLSLDQLQTFVDVIEQGSFSAAAERLNLSQPAVSLQVRQLERRLGVRLIERIGRRAAPTAAGSALLAHARNIDASVSAALGDMARHAGGGGGRVRLGTGATACIYVLPQILRILRQRNPALEITVTTGNTDGIVKAVEENALDIGFVTLPASGRMLEATPVLQDEFVAITPAQGPALPANVTPSVLAGLPLLLYEPGGNSRRLVDEWFARAGLAPKPVMALGNTEAIKEMVGAGLGCAVLPAMAMQRQNAAALAVRSLTPRLHRTLAVVVRRDKTLDRGLRDAIGALVALGSA